ncbi:MAG: 4Fe-4S binding protein [Eggerthellaceae bacterium]|nr:4Fe-4S binding protein [Eggerthellaceae bacterium]
MKRVYVEEAWCLACHLCEYNCAFANSGEPDMVLALKGKPIYPRIHIEGTERISYAVSCRHCIDPICLKSCIAGAISAKDGVIVIDKDKCVGCFTCVLVCPYGALAVGETGIMQKCELCLKNSCGEPACVKGCPNHAIVYEERSEAAL